MLSISILSKSGRFANVRENAMYLVLLIFKVNLKVSSQFAIVYIPNFASPRTSDQDLPKKTTAVSSA